MTHESLLSLYQPHESTHWQQDKTQNSKHIHGWSAFDRKKKYTQATDTDFFFPRGNSVLAVIFSYDFMNNLQNMKLGVALKLLVYIDM